MATTSYLLNDLYLGCIALGVGAVAFVIFWLYTGRDAPACEDCCCGEAPDIDPRRTWEPGCYVDGHHGQYAIDALIELAVGAGYELDYEAEIVLEAREEDNFDSVLLPGPPDEPLTNVYEYMVELADSCEEWLNAHEAPEGYSFGWYEGEFYLWPDTEWIEESHE